MSDDPKPNSDPLDFDPGLEPPLLEPAELLVVEPMAEGDIELVVPAEPIETLTTEFPGEDLGSVPGLGTPSDAALPLAELAQAIASLDQSLGRRLDALQSQFDREIRAEVTREKVVDRLHAELQAYKQDLLLNTLRPMFIDLIQLHDDIGKILASAASGDTPADRLPSLIEGFQQGIEDILYRQGVEPFTTDDDAFDARRQRALGTQPSPDPALDRRVAQRLRKGFAAGEKVIRPEIVSVYASRPR